MREGNAGIRRAKRCEGVFEKLGKESYSEEKSDARQDTEESRAEGRGWSHYRDRLNGHESKVRTRPGEGR